MDPSAPLRERLGLVADAADGIIPFEAIGFVLPPVEDEIRALVWTDRDRHRILEQRFRTAELPSTMGQRVPAHSRLLASDLDSGRPFDRELLARRVGALLAIPVASVGRPALLWVALAGPSFPAEAQARALEALARLCGLPAPAAGTAAFGEPEELHRLEVLDELLTALTGVLDVRNVFVRISEIAKQVIPHDCLGMPTVAEDGRHFIPYAITDAVMPALPPQIPIEDPTILTRPCEYTIVDDISVKPREAIKLFVQAGYRGQLRLPAQGQDGSPAGFLVIHAGGVLEARRARGAASPTT